MPLKIFLFRSTEPISRKLVTKHPWMKFIEMKGQALLQGNMIVFCLKDILIMGMAIGLKSIIG